MSYVSQELGTDEIRIMALIKNCMSIVANGLSLITQKEGSCLILLSPILLEHLLPLALTGALS